MLIRSMKKDAGVFWILVLSLSVLPGWSFLQRPNRDVEKGNGFLSKGKSEKALDAYDRASRSLGRMPDLGYNRALALLGAGKPEEAVNEFMEASTKGDSGLRWRARYNLGNTYSKMSKNLVEKGNKKVVEAAELFQKAKEAGLEREGEPPKEACEILRQSAAAYKEAAEKHSDAKSLLEKAVGEYRNVLLRKSSNFKAKWNLELALRGMDVSDSVSEEAERVASLYAERCEKQDEQDDQKDQDKGDDQDDQKDQDKGDDQDDQKDQDKGDDQDDQKDQDKQDEKDKQDKRQEQQDQKDQPYDPKEERRREAERALDRLQRKQREQRREMQKSQMPAGRPPVMDW